MYNQNQQDCTDKRPLKNIQRLLCMPQQNSISVRLPVSTFWGSELCNLTFLRPYVQLSCRLSDWMTSELLLTCLKRTEKQEAVQLSESQERRRLEKVVAAGTCPSHLIHWRIHLKCVCVVFAVLGTPVHLQFCARKAICCCSPSGLSNL